MTRPRLGRPWRRTVAYVIQRDPTCRLHYPDICLGHSTTADHIVPRSAGGTDHPDNLQAACQPCNQHRSDGPTPATDQNRQTRKWT